MRLLGTIEPWQAGTRVLRALRTLLPAHIKHGDLHRLLRKGAILVRDPHGARLSGRSLHRTQLAAGSTIYAADSVVSHHHHDHDDHDDDHPHPSPDSLAAITVHADADYLVVSKPPGVAAQGGSADLVDIDGLLRSAAAAAALPGPPALASARPFLVHRLDTPTSGLMAAARSRHVAAAAAAAFASGHAAKAYIGVLAHPAAGAACDLRPGVPITVDTPLARGPRRSMALARAADSDLPASTTVVPLLTLAQRSLVGFVPHTGRKHQLRVHSALALRCPLVGDARYGGPPLILPHTAPRSRLALHSAALSLPGLDRITDPPPAALIAAALSPSKPSSDSALITACTQAINDFLASPPPAPNSSSPLECPGKQ